MTFSNSKKVEPTELCKFATEVIIEVEPDGLVKDREKVLWTKLHGNGQTLVNPQLLVGTGDLSRLPSFSIFDMYNFLLSHEGFTHESLQEYQKQEGYTMFKDGYAISLTSATYDTPGLIIYSCIYSSKSHSTDHIQQLQSFVSDT